MFEAETEIVKLQSRLGRVGYVQAWNPWESRRSVKHAKYWVSKIARLSHGLGETEDFVAHFDRVVNHLKHESVLEFVPFGGTTGRALPGSCLRSRGITSLRNDLLFTPRIVDAQAQRHPASAFLVECPIFVARQWMRHRSFAYLEMSRRYTKGNRVPWGFSGVDTSVIDEDVHDKHDVVTVETFHAACEAEYQRRLDAGWPNEIARGCMPVEAMTKFWVAGFDRDWEAFLKLRDDAHAQPEIRVFASWIRTYLDRKASHV